MKTVDIEKINRDNFKSIMKALSMPGNVHTIQSLFDSNLLAIANTLLYSQVSFTYEGNEEFELVSAITNAKETAVEEADYIFCDEINEYMFNKGKVGTTKEPEFSSTFIFKCENFQGLKVRLTGPGIDRHKDITLPVDHSFVTFFNEKNAYYPMGSEVLFLNESAEVLALSRTTQMEVL